MEISQELNRLLCAALVSQTFREKLLADPLTAIREGYVQGSFGTKKFNLTDEEVHIISNIQSNTIQDFASQIIKNNLLQKIAAPSTNGSTKSALNGNRPYLVQTNGKGKHGLQSNDQ